MTDPDTPLILAWHEALNAGDADRLVSLSTDDVEMGGPRGPARGAAVLREWVARAGIRLEPVRLFHRDGVVVAEESATWPALAGVDAPAQVVATAFRVRDGRVAAVARHADLAAALHDAGLAESDEVSLA